MIIGIGNDIVDIRRLARVAARYPQRFVRYILTETEQQQLPTQHRTLYLAGRWAAKEALGKALGCGVRTPVSWQQVSIAPDATGKPCFVFSPAAAAYIKQCGIGTCHLSISHDGNYASAMVVAEKMH